MTSFDADAARTAVLSEGSVDIPVEFDGQLQQVRFHQVPHPAGLTALVSPPPADADQNAAVDKLRGRLRRALGISQGPPVVVTQALSALFGYRGTQLTSTAEGLRVLLSLPNVDGIEWVNLMTVLSPDAEPSEPTSAPSAPDHRLGQLEASVSTLTASFRNLELNIGQHIAAAVQAALSAQAPKPSRGSPEAAPRNAGLSSPSGCDDHPMSDNSPPVWEFKSSSPAMVVLGTIYSHLLQTGAHQLAAELYGVKATVDYAFLPATQATPDDTEHIYKAKHSGKSWKTDHPPPRPCYECGLMHWRSECPALRDKKQQTASRSFPRGQPPGRFYISKGGQCYDTSRKPNFECSRCGKFHWWFCCPRGPETVHIPTGASFVQKTDLKPMNQGSSRFKQRTTGATSSSDAEAATSDASSSSAAELLPAKRGRRTKPSSAAQPAAHHAPAGQSSAAPTPANWGWYPPPWTAPPWGYPQWSTGNPGPYSDPYRPQPPRFPGQFQPSQTEQPPAPGSVPQQATQAMPMPPPPPPPGTSSHQPYWAPPGPEMAGTHPPSY